ncbi:MAG: hypothetical protein ACE5F6_10960 [Anaerolineae bacterium]
MMSPSANVLAIHALEELKVALGRFGGEAQAALRTAEQEIRRTLEWLQERQAHWEREVRRRQEEVRQARAALERCRASARHDPKTGRSHVPDCSRYEHALAQARGCLREAEAELRNVREWSRQVQQTAADYQRQAQRLAAMLSNDLPKATALLGRKITTLQPYVAMTAPAGQAGMRPAASPFQRAGGMAQAQGSQWHTAGQPDGIRKLEDGLTGLQGTVAGHAIAAAIHEQNTTVRFGETGQNVIACFDPNSNEIVIHEGLQDASPNVLAAHLAHEGTHVQWSRDDSIDQEYHAFKAQAEVWDELKGDEADEQCDRVSGMISLGEMRAKWVIRDLYPKLPDYA